MGNRSGETVPPGTQKTANQGGTRNGKSKWNHWINVHKSIVVCSYFYPNGIGGAVNERIGNDKRNHKKQRDQGMR